MIVCDKVPMWHDDTCDTWHNVLWPALEGWQCVVCCHGDLREFHSHEDTGHEEAEEHTDEADEEQQEAIELRDVGRVRTVQDDEAQTAHGEKEARGQTLHDVLPIHPERKKQTSHTDFINTFISEK